MILTAIKCAIVYVSQVDDESKKQHNKKGLILCICCIHRLQKSLKADNKQVYYQIVAKCAKELSNLQRGRLPPELKEIVQKKWEDIEEKKKV